MQRYAQLHCVRLGHGVRDGSWEALLSVDLDLGFRRDKWGGGVESQQAIGVSSLWTEPKKTTSVNCLEG